MLKIKRRLKNFPDWQRLKGHDNRIFCYKNIETIGKTWKEDSVLDVLMSTSGFCCFSCGNVGGCS